MTVREWMKLQSYPMLGRLVLTPVPPEVVASVSDAVPLDGPTGGGLTFPGEEGCFELEYASYRLKGARVLYVQDRQEMRHPRWGSTCVEPGWYLTAHIPSAVLDSEASVNVER